MPPGRPGYGNGSALAHVDSDVSASLSHSTRQPTSTGGDNDVRHTRSQDSEQTLQHDPTIIRDESPDVVDVEKGIKATKDGQPNASAKRLATDGSPVIVLDWDKDDPEFPQNWPRKQRLAATFVVAAFTFLSPLSSTMIAPCSGEVARALGMETDIERQMVTSIFVLAYAFGPLLLGPSSEIWGRAKVLQLANLVYLVFNLMCAFAQTKAQFFVFRLLAGLGGSAPLAIGAGVLGDLWRPAERGTAASLYSLGPLLGPAVGPIAGGWIAQTLPDDGWKWVFYSTSIFCAGVQTVGLFFLRETYAPVLLGRRVKAKKKELGLSMESDKVQTIYDLKGRKSYGHVVSHGLVKPFVLFAAERILNVLALYLAIIYGMIYLITTTTTTIFTDVYGQSVGIAGTHFVAQGLGFLVGAQANGRILDRMYRKLQASNNDIGQPEFRLPVMVPASIILPAGIFLYGWTAQARGHWIGVDFGMAFVAAAMISIFQSTNLYLVDSFGIYAASAIASVTFWRSLCGFAFPIFAPALFQALGYGGGASLLAGIVILVGCPAAPVLWKYGERIRMSSRFAAKRKEGA
ncbi:hypothetical protein OIO90_001064 [Microbotryomycetes sp. JL221]|nr:hypothetical protein OIO90_001064 [Microbotryomycetes sp. JL221]